MNEEDRLALKSLIQKPDCVYGWKIDPAVGPLFGDMQVVVDAALQLRRIALNLVRRDVSSKRSLKDRRKICGWNNEYLYYRIPRIL